MRLTAQITSPRQNALDYFRNAGPEILDEEDYAPLKEIEDALIEQGLSPDPWDEFIDRQIMRVASEENMQRPRHH